MYTEGHRKDKERLRRICVVEDNEDINTKKEN
jgi:hypothetical protein